MRRMQRQRHGLARDALGHREIPFACSRSSRPSVRQVQRFIRYTGADAARLHRVAKRLARERHAVERQQHAPHVPRLAVVAGRARRQHAGGIGGEALEIAVDERAAAGEELRQPRELRDADPRIDVGQVELAAGKGDVARAIGQVDDAVEAQRFDALRLVGVVDDQRAAFDRGDVLVRMEAERDEVAERADVAALPARAHAPARRPRSRAGRAAARARSSASMSTSEPGQCVGMMARVRGVIAASTAARSMLRVTRSQSTNTGLAPTLAIMLSTVKKLCADGDHLVARADAAELQRDLDRGGGRREHAHRPAAAERRQRRLELLHPRAARELPGAQHVADAGDRRLVEHGAGELDVGQGAHRAPDDRSAPRDQPDADDDEADAEPARAA